MKIYDKNKILDNNLAQIKKKCKHCGHTIYMYNNTNYVLCRWCGNYIFRNDKIEFEYRIKERIRKNV